MRWRVLAHPDDVQDLRDALPDLRLGQLLLLQPEGDVAEDGHVRKERIGLEHHVDGPLVRRNVRHILAVNEDPARRWLLEARQHAQQRRLAAAGCPQQAEYLTLVDLERYAIDRHEVAEALADVLNGDVRRAVRVLPGLVPRRHDVLSFGQPLAAQQPTATARLAAVAQVTCRS